MYWQAAECEWRDGRWHSVEIARRIDAGGVAEVIPVFRLKPNPAFLGSPVAVAALAGQIRAWWGKPEPLAEVQLDFDCPDRVLGDYAGFLGALGRQLAPTRISATALAAWPDHPQFRKLAAAVHALVPMFYDLQADAAAAVREDRYVPLAGAGVAPWILKWRACPVVWYAGLPNFERVSVFRRDGDLIGHLRGWTHDPLLFQPALTGRSAGAGVAVFEVLRPTALAGTRLEPGQRVVWRTVDAGALAGMADAARQAGAGGVVYFALPGPGLQAAFSASHLGTAVGSAADLALDRTGDGELVLHNRGPVDLPARVVGAGAPGERGWALVLRAAERGTFRGSGTGEFALAESPDGVPAEESRVLILRFSRLPAGASVRSGRCLAKAAGVRWEVPGTAAEQPLAAGE